jgi:aspartyl-tRNA(Asn)/glutamyl-tRNA(Gln) amidotransferase subunit C
MPEIVVDKELIKKVAKNARLTLTDEEVEKFEPQLKEIILESFNKLDEIEVDEEPSFQPIESKNNFRKDEVKESLELNDVMKNVSQKLRENNYVKGPKVL